MFYFVRHGETDANCQGLMCGRKWDLSLNPKGFDQVQETATKFRAKVPDLTAVFCSPLLRARQTAIPFAEAYELSVSLWADLEEWDMGGWDRQPFETVKSSFLGDADPDGGETRGEFRERVAGVIKKIDEHPSPFLLVSHGAFWLFMQQILGIPSRRSANSVPFKVSRSQSGVWEAESIL